MSLLAILPLLICALVILVARRSAIVGASAGIVVALAMIGLMSPFSLSAAGGVSALLEALILTLSASVVILPGLYFNALLRGHGAISAIQHWVERLPYADEHKVLLLLFGLLPAVESLTGFGVSLFLSVPILFHLFRAPVAYRLVMLGMNIMPWGTLALATVVGAALSGVSVNTLGWYTSFTSALVFPTLSLIALYVIGGMSMLRQRLFSALSLSFSLSLALILLSHMHMVEVAAVLAGMAVCLIGAMALPTVSEATRLPDHREALRAFLPYGLVLLIILLERFVPGAYVFLCKAVVLREGDVSFKVLTSPGVVLLLVAVLIYLFHPIALPHRTVLTRAWTASLSLFAFIVLAQIMRHSGMIAVLAKAMSAWDGDALLMISPLVGVVSGFITGSNTSGNALMMAVQSDIGAHFGLTAIFASAQNSGAGHATFTSIPIIVLILTLASDVTAHASGNDQTREHHLLRFGLQVLLCLLPALILMTWLISKWFAT